MVVAILGKEEEEEYLHGDIYKHQPDSAQLGKTRGSFRRFRALFALRHCYCCC
jgi:hypothetical protein